MGWLDGVEGAVEVTGVQAAASSASSRYACGRCCGGMPVLAELRFCCPSAGWAGDGCGQRRGGAAGCIVVAVGVARGGEAVSSSSRRGIGGPWLAAYQRQCGGACAGPEQACWLEGRRTGRSHGPVMGLWACCSMGCGLCPCVCVCGCGWGTVWGEHWLGRGSVAFEIGVA